MISSTLEYHHFAGALGIPAREILDVGAPTKRALCKIPSLLIKRAGEITVDGPAPRNGRSCAPLFLRFIPAAVLPSIEAVC
jgi:hypothetical protein